MNKKKAEGENRGQYKTQLHKNSFIISCIFKKMKKKSSIKKRMKATTHTVRLFNKLI